ncbi:Gfo/Idh/MocA family protein [Brevibacillus parabrevis]|uniref:Gfo/Idh/MocA family protein n=1 Tax=Brevibacillus parabrevis TaxID=54914 RepID=UPI001F601349|nr:Gfo/Idh/MocA family oxidoreductase [Brevibacillus parabrevis]MDR4997936.1 Gfo/Idh/MocA family oxidoreductase [Brevibacillus parabrevis]
MKALVIGFGSIGMRHARVLTSLGCKVAVVSRREIEWDCYYPSISEALIREEPDYVIVANRTSEHLATISELNANGFKGKVLIEKPIFDHECNMPNNSFQKLYVGYNLRFHPGIQKLRSLLANKTVLSFHVYTGQYLPQWRPQADYRESYSASKEKGGGVLRDLSHELDYTNWLLGGWESLTAVGGKFSELEISSDDVYTLLMRTKLCPAVTISVNYLDRVAKRFVIVNTDHGTIKLDMIQNTITVNEEHTDFNVSRDFTYIEQHRAALSGVDHDICRSDEAMQVMSMIKAAEEANEKRSWVTR